MQLICGSNLEKLVDYNFGDHHVVWDSNLTGEFKVANASNAEFLIFCQKNQDKVLTLFIDNVRLYKRSINFTGQHANTDAQFIAYLMHHNDLLELCAQLPNKFIIFTSHEDTPIDETIKIPANIITIHAVNALFNNDKIHPFPIGLQRQIGKNDNRLQIMNQLVEFDQEINLPSKLLYINCGIERNPERLPLAKFEGLSWCTTRFDKDSKYFPYERYNEFLSELRDHKFIVCPKGHGFDTHRIWETLYMRRVPVMLDHPYFRRLLVDFPVLFVNKWEDITEELLTINNDLYLSAQEFDMNKLDLNVLFSQTKEKASK